MATYNQPTAAPTSKVAAAGIAGTIVTLVIFIAAQFNFVIPSEVAAAAVTLASFIAGYFKKASV